jgi:hypothetical protein
MAGEVSECCSGAVTTGESAGAGAVEITTASFLATDRDLLGALTAGASGAGAGAGATDRDLLGNLAAGAATDIDLLGNLAAAAAAAGARVVAPAASTAVVDDL